MKNSKAYAAKIAKFFRSAGKGKTEAPSYGDPVEAMIFGIISEHVDALKAERVYKAMQKHFVDWNDLRVSRFEEVSEVLDEPADISAAVANSLGLSLNHIFNEHDCVNLSSLGDEGKRVAKKTLTEIAGLSDYVVDYVMLTDLQGHSMPLTVRMLSFLKENELVDAGASAADIQGFLQRQIPAADGYAFYAALRAAAERPAGAAAGSRSVKTARARASGGARSVKAPARKKTAKKATAKKTVKKVANKTAKKSAKKAVSKKAAKKTAQKKTAKKTAASKKKTAKKAVKKSARKG